MIIAEEFTCSMLEYDVSKLNLLTFPVCYFCMWICSQRHLHFYAFEMDLYVLATQLKKERYCVSRHYLGMGSASIVETSSRVKNIKVTYIDHSHAILRHENEAISVLALVNSDYVCC